MNHDKKIFDDIMCDYHIIYDYFNFLPGKNVCIMCWQILYNVFNIFSIVL